VDVLIVVDMQEGLHDGKPKHDFPGVLARINRLLKFVRGHRGQVVFVQHAGLAGDAVEKGTAGWQILRDLERDVGDKVIAKSYNDSFFETSLLGELRALAPDRVIITGWATDMCVDATVRSAAALGFKVVAVADGTTLADRPHLKAATIIEHHHWMWQNVISKHPVQVLRAEEILS